MLCEELMTADVGVAFTGQPVRAAARVMRDLNVGFVPVCQSDGTVVGTVTDRDLAIRVLAEELPPSTPLDDVMSDGLVTCKPSDDIRAAEERMRTNQVNRILVIGDDGKLAGVISLADLAQYENEQRVGELAADITERETTIR